ncbi:LysM peptidoglycan-binding domain-containing protein [Pseudooceanicola algae]|uniref:LysM peptidoglycan-binding domain-containing protein n=1 Tax=Pseudooceanicola algae TaxID=1537215 RepID=UPI0018AD2F5F|nr:LysM peptidoglycan-binding domain-containing protein [Pseudooceanicola algae]
MAGGLATGGAAIFFGWIGPQDGGKPAPAPASEIATEVDAPQPAPDAAEARQLAAVTPPETAAQAAEIPPEDAAVSDDLSPDPVAPVAEEIAEPAAPVPVPDVEAEQTAVAPSFDIVRMEGDGTALVAGQAAPNTSVSIQLDGVEIDRSLAGADGRFVSFLDITPGQAAQVMTLQGVGADGIADTLADQQVILAPVVTAAAQPATTSEAEPEIAALAAETPQATDSPASPVEPAGSVEAPQVVAAAAPVPTVLMAEGDGVQVLQQSDAPTGISGVELSTIAYDANGAVVLSGLARPGGYVRCYLDGILRATVDVGASGEWESRLTEVEPGVYSLRLDEVDDAGEVLSRVETPFERETPERIAAAQTAALGPAEQVTIQPGNTLWAIARDSYGQGVLYVRVFEANRELIRNPHLIYPGQVFTLPAAD